MAAEPVVVDHVRDIARERSPRGARAKGGASEAPIRVRFASGVDGRLDPTKARDMTWAEVLQSLHDTKQPAYVTIDSDTGYITSLLLPRRFFVTDLRKTESGDVEVELEISHARHYLRRDREDFESVFDELEQARRGRTPVLVTESLDSSAIVDVRPAGPAPARRGQ